MSTVAVVAAQGLLRAGICTLLRVDANDVVEVGPDDEVSLVSWWDLYGPGVETARRLTESDAVVVLVDHLDTVAIFARLKDCVPDSTHLLAVVPADTLELSVHLVEAGAQSVLSSACTPAELFVSLRASELGMASVPQKVVRSLASPHSRALDSHELRWLHELSRGATVAQVARKAGFAERSFYRRLQRVYTVLGRDNRTEALLEARRQGLL